MNPRRPLLLTLGASLSGQAALLRAQTPAPTMRRVGVLAPSTQAKVEITLKPFYDQMHQLGWVEGRTLSMTASMPTIRWTGCPSSPPSWWRASRS